MHSFLNRFPQVLTLCSTHIHAPAGMNGVCTRLRPTLNPQVLPIARDLEWAVVSSRIQGSSLAALAGMTCDGR